MDISVVIVNYNVKYFLEQCLQSVQRASKNLDVETIVVDNNSVDGSAAFIKARFADIIYVENDVNVGFSKANNQGFRMAKGNYILMLNPDTILQEDTLHKCFHFMENNQDAGALGVKMIDGKGRFLPESKRALPTPSVSFYKIFGLAKVFPRSERFARYHLGHLDENQIHEIEILPGAFMFMRKTALDKTGGLDEQYFMYGEDIDLSYRFIKAGYKNYYFPETTIIHYKGESTKKGSINYVMMFYNAMLIFAKTHFSKKYFKLYSFFINLAIYFRAALSIFKRMTINVLTPVLDGLSFFVSMIFLSEMWSTHLFGKGNQYPDEFIYFIIPFYIIIWIISIFLAGGYDKPIRPVPALKGMIYGTIFILIAYALLPESMRFSRALILMGAASGSLLIIIIRWMLSLLKSKTLKAEFLSSPQRIIIIANPEEAERITKLLAETDTNTVIAGYVAVHENLYNPEYLGNISQIKEIVKINKIDEVIFSAKDISSQLIIEKMLELTDTSLDFKIAPKDSLSIIGSNSIDTSGDLYTISINSIGKPVNRRKKRFFDLLTAFILFVSIPITIWFIKHPAGFIKNIFSVIMGNKSWVGYSYVLPSKGIENLPVIRKGILSPACKISRKHNATQQSVKRLNFIYAKDYTIRADIIIIINNFKYIGV
jgi:GT2 family glycosyltransferase